MVTGDGDLPRAIDDISISIRIIRLLSRIGVATQLGSDERGSSEREDSVLLGLVHVHIRGGIRCWLFCHCEV
jgi:hypothetical protein